MSDYRTSQVGVISQNISKYICLHIDDFTKVTLQTQRYSNIIQFIVDLIVTQEMISTRCERENTVSMVVIV